MAVKTELHGLVVSDKMDKTVVVAVTRRVRHPLYGKIMKRTRKFVAHDEANVAKVGDRVVIIASRPLSRHKRWALTRVVKQAKGI
ncbi:MAG: 30S ribosomal protein S17 [Luteitalea sp.]|nr:30S ribosomal protein S17 [Luteitalea sp.]